MSLQRKQRFLILAVICLIFITIISWRFFSVRTSTVKELTLFRSHSGMACKMDYTVKIVSDGRIIFTEINYSQFHLGPGKILQEKETRISKNKVKNIFLKAETLYENFQDGNSLKESIFSQAFRKNLFIPVAYADLDAQSPFSISMHLKNGEKIFLSPRTSSPQKGNEFDLRLMDFAQYIDEAIRTDQWLEYSTDCKEKDKKIRLLATAIATGNHELCDQITDEYSASNCHNQIDASSDYFFKTKAINEKDLTYCQVILNGAEDCLLMVSQLIADKNICSEFSQSKPCESTDAVTCERQEASDVRDTCYTAAAVKEKDSTVCDQFISWHSNSNHDRCYDRVARATKDTSVCKKIIDEREKEFCIDSIQSGRTFQHDPLRGFKIEKLDEKYIDEDYWRLEEAIRKKDDNLCENIERSTLQNICHSKLAKIILNPNLCNNIEDIKMKDTCHVALAELMKDPTVCVLDSSPSNKDNCYDAVVIFKKDPDYCEAMDDLKRKEGCYARLGEILADETLCNEISDSNRKTRCLVRILSQKNGLTLELCNSVSFGLGYIDKAKCIYDLARQENDKKFCEVALMPFYDYYYNECLKYFSAK